MATYHCARWQALPLWLCVLLIEFVAISVAPTVTSSATDLRAKKRCSPAIFVQRKATLLSNRSNSFGHNDMNNLTARSDAVGWPHMSQLKAFNHSSGNANGLLSSSAKHFRAAFVELQRMAKACVKTAVFGATSRSRLSPSAYVICLVVLALVVVAAVAMYFHSQRGFGPRQNHPQHATGSHGQPSCSTVSKGSPFRQEDILDSQLQQRPLCPSLVVPSGMELVFAMPEMLTSQRQHLSFNILDLQGKPLSKVVVDEAGPKAGIILRSLDDRLLARVRTGHLHDTGTGVPEICWPSGEVFGALVREAPRTSKHFTLRDWSGKPIFTFHGNFWDKAINVLNADGCLVCDTERCVMPFDKIGSYYQVRVAPEVDAGLIICSLFTIDKLRAT